jgi:hypothetical protein
MSALARWLPVAGVEVLCLRVDGENADRLHERGLHVLRLAAGRAYDHRGEDPGRRRGAGDKVRERRARELRRIGVAEDGQQPATRLAYCVAGWSEGQRAAASESVTDANTRSGRGAVQSSGPRPSDRILRGRGFSHDVEAREESFHHLDSLGPLEVYREAALSRVVLAEEGLGIRHPYRA